MSQAGDCTPNRQRNCGRDVWFTIATFCITTIASLFRAVLALISSLSQRRLCSLAAKSTRISMDDLGVTYQFNNLRVVVEGPPKCTN
jgi:hypothetical protein